MSSIAAGGWSTSCYGRNKPVRVGVSAFGARQSVSEEFELSLR